MFGKEIEKTEFVFIPSLLSLLINAQEKSEKPLSKAQVLKIRDEANVILVTQTVAVELSNQRGYHDIYAPKVWEEWQEYQKGNLDFELKK